MWGSGSINIIRAGLRSQLRRSPSLPLYNHYGHLRRHTRRRIHRWLDQSSLLWVDLCTSVPVPPSRAQFGQTDDAPCGEHAFDPVSGVTDS